MNTYAPNDFPSYCLLWKSLAQDLPHTCRCILMADFNMIKHRVDKTKQCCSMIPSKERLLFDAMKSTLHIRDNARSAFNLRFSWNNNSSMAAHVLGRLYRIYFFQSNFGYFDKILLDYSIRGNLTRSDHHPITAARRTTR